MADEQSMLASDIPPQRVPENVPPCLPAHTATGMTREIQRKLHKLEPYDGGNPNIFEVPSRLRQLEESDPYTPGVVSIGPRHKELTHLKEFEKHKWQLLQHLLDRTKISLDDLVKDMPLLLPNAKKYYDKPILQYLTDDQQFVEMLLLDACFILELLHNSANEWKDTSNPLYVLRQRGVIPFIRRDLLMLENQLPFLVLQKIFTILGYASAMSIVALALEFFKKVIRGISENISDNPGYEPLHLLDIIHKSLEPPKPPRAVEPDSETSIWICSCCPSPHHLFPCWQVTYHATRNGHDEHGERVFHPLSSKDGDVHSVTRLRDTGIKFEKKDSTKFTEIEFKEGKLLIPRLFIHGSTRFIFLNLMAFEQFYPHCGRYFTAYISFMDGLINSSKDVEHLIEKGIIAHQLGSEEDVATLINNLRKGMVFDKRDNYLSKISKQLNEHYEQKWRTWNATLKHEYLKDPWKIISLVAAGLLIFLTIVQTAYTMAGHHFPKN